MALTWKIDTAIDYCDAVKDGTHDSPKQTTIGFKLITSKHIGNGSLDLASAYYISPSDYESINRRSKVDKNDVLFSMIGTVGRIYRVECEPCFAIKNMGLFKVSDELKSKWLYYFLQTPESNNYLNGVLAGSTQKYVSLSALRAFPIRFPSDKKVMQQIVQLLDSLDSKIKCNTKLNGYLAAYGLRPRRLSRPT